MTHDAPAGIGARLDRLPVTPFHRRIFALVALGMFFDGFDIYIAGSVLGATFHAGFSTVAQNGLFISATFVGMMLGAFLTGFVGDRFGRRVSYQINLAIFGLASLAAAVAPDMSALIAIRFFMGLGLGAEAVTGYSIITEFVPPEVRGRWSGFIATIVTSGLPVSAFLAFAMVPSLGWRSMFVVGGVGALIVWWLRQGLPESPRWLEANGRHAEAEAIVSEIEAAATGVLAPPVRDPAPRPAGPKLGFRRALSRRSADADDRRLHSRSSPSICSSTALSSGFPPFLVKQGFGMATSFGYVLFMSLGGPVGSGLGAFTADALGRKVSIIGAGVAAIVFALLFPFARGAVCDHRSGFSVDRARLCPRDLVLRHLHSRAVSDRRAAARGRHLQHGGARRKHRDAARRRAVVFGLWHRRRSHAHDRRARGDDFRRREIRHRTRPAIARKARNRGLRPAFFGADSDVSL